MEEGDTELIDAMIANKRSINAELADSTSRKIRKAVRRAEAVVGIKSGDRVKFMHSWLADEWGYLVADDAIDPEEVDRVVRDLEMLANRSKRLGHSQFKNSPGAYVNSRLKALARCAGVDLRSGANPPEAT